MRHNGIEHQKFHYWSKERVTTQIRKMRNNITQHNTMDNRIKNVILGVTRALWVVAGQVLGIGGMVVQ